MELEASLNSLINCGQSEIREIIEYLYIFHSLYNKDMVETKNLNVLKKKKKIQDWRSEVINTVKEYIDSDEKNQIVHSFSMLETSYELVYLSKIITILQTIKEKQQKKKKRYIFKEKQVQSEKLHSSVKKISNNQVNNSKVFIVHGHSQTTIFQTEAFLRKIGLEPIILRDQANQGQTIIEKFEKYTDVAFAIVLYTACDFGCSKEDWDKDEKLRPRARQNVVFEHGYLNAKLGRKKVCALVEKGVEFPSDLSGIIYVEYDDKGKWLIDIAREMKVSGIDVDMNKVFL